MSLFVPVLAAVSLVAAVYDLRSRRIPNPLSAVLALLGVVAAGLERGWGGVGIALLTLAVLLALGTVAFGRGLIGGGDIKLIAAGCCGLTPGLAVDFLLYTALFGGLVSLATLAASGRLTASLVTGVYVRGRERVPYAVAVWAGAVALGVACIWPAFLIVR